MACQIIIILSCILACSAQFTDDMQIYEAECLGENRIHCGDGRCIWQEQYCDGNVDCADGSDENLCLEHTPDQVLCNTTHQFMCTDKKKCLPVSWLCNNDTDCEDGSDEANCTFNEISKNATCKGFTCKSDGRCISRLWACDGSYDCADLSDEDPVACKALLIYRWKYYPSACDGHSILMLDRSYRCLDSSFCLPSWMMCDGLPDCRDGSDEGAFCKGWTDQCLNHTCGKDDRAFCTRSRDGPECVCRAYSTFNSTTKGCVAVDMCSEARPVCPQQCTHHDGPFLCTCEEGYTPDRLGIGDVCFAAGPEAMLFFTTRNDIRYMKRSTKQVVTVVTGIKEAHGVSYDGKYLYWVETAEGHQAIIRAHLENVEETKQVLVSLGLEDPGDISVDWQGGHAYFSDAERGVISACRVDGSICTTVSTDARMPKFVTLDPRNGTMYWADWHGRPLIMRARMDGSSAAPLVGALRNFPSGLALDAPSHRLYYVDTVLMGVNIDNGKIFSVFEEPRHHPYGVAVFENAVYWSDWATDSIQVTDKLLGAEQRTSVVIKLKTPIYHLHVYHPILMKAASNPCAAHRCSHLCLLRSNETFTCACPEGMELEDNYTCQHIKGYRPLYLVVGGGASFTRIQYNALGNPETHAAYFNIGRVQAMAYDSLRDTLYVYDAHHKGINYISMAEFTLGVTHLLLYKGLENVVDMDYDYVSDSLYILDAGRRFVEVVSLRTQKRALLHRFDDEVPISFCVLPDYGKMLVAVSNSENKEEIHIDSIGLDGSGRQHIVMNNLKGPRVQLRYAHNMGLVYVADEGNRVIDFMHPQGTGRETFVELSSSVMSLAVGDSLAFWAGRAQRLYWADVHRSRPAVRRLDLSIFPNTSLLHLQVTFPTSDYSTHPCQRTPNPCSDVCVQTPTSLTLGSQSNTGSPPNAGYKCLCPPGLLNLNGKCTALIVCKEDEAFCHRSDICIRKTAVCDGKPDCFDGEDEEDCPAVEPSKTSLCQYSEIICNGVCMHESGCSASANASTTVAPICSAIEFECSGDRLCISRSQLCDGAMDCDDGSDEAPAFCDTLNCLPTEFISECMPFENQTVIPLTHEFISISCTGLNDTYGDYFLFVKKRNFSENMKRDFSVLVLGVDTMSRDRAYDSLVKTTNLLDEQGWLDFRGYNKVGLNSAPNVIPLLTGKKYFKYPPQPDYSDYYTSWCDTCSKNMTSCNNLIIWSEYKKKGYVTAFGEDSVYLGSSFNEDSVFQDNPTHHFLRPFFKSGERNEKNACTGQIPSTQQHLTYVLDYSKTYKDVKSFGVFWFDSISHNYNDSPKHSDEILYKFFERLNAIGIMYDTFIIFLGDHGIRHGYMKLKIESYYEDRLPMLFMWVPPKFKRRFPKLYRNLKLNQGRLTSPYDLYLTLLEILLLSKETRKVKKAAACPTCKSMFKEMSKYRSCPDAGIPALYCACHILFHAPKYDFSTVYSVTRAFQFLKNTARRIPTNPCTTCEDFSFVQLERVHYYYSDNSKNMHYLIVFTVDPENVIYEIAVNKYINSNNTFSYDVDYAEPISSFDNYGYCVTDVDYKYLCVCKEIQNCLNNSEVARALKNGGARSSRGISQMINLRNSTLDSFPYIITI